MAAKWPSVPMQRHNELLECAQAITGHNFHFGIGIRGSSMSSLGV